MKRMIILIGLPTILLISGCNGTEEMAPITEEPVTTTGEHTVTSTKQPSLQAVGYAIVDTGQDKCYNNSYEIACPQPGEAFYGQDAQYQGIQPAYQDNEDGTVTDLNTGLMWQKSMKKIAWTDAASDAAQDTTGGYTDWQVPTIKELYSLINFDGTTGSAPPESSSVPDDALPYIDTDYFDFEYGTTARYIDAQYLSSTEYVSTTMNGDATIFGVNFADGRIKGYPKSGNPQTGTFYARYVRGNTNYGTNKFIDNGDNTITDEATALMWMKVASGEGMNWEDALAWVQQKNQENYLGYNDWRLPNAKELQSIVDYMRSPDTTNSPAIDPIFNTISITNEGGEKDYPFFWTSTSHLEGGADKAVYIAFGQSLGFMQTPAGGFLGGPPPGSSPPQGSTPPNTGDYIIMDVHGAGSQRSDFKIGDPNDYPYGHGPQGDVIRIFNFVRCVRDTN